MKRKMLSIALLAMLALGCSAKASAKDVAIDETNFPDPGLREYVQTAYDTNKDGVLSDEENKAATIMSVYFNADPNLMISIREDNTDDYFDLGKWKVHKEFPCAQIAENPLNAIAKEQDTNAVCYVVGNYPWLSVINNSVKNWQGLELLTSLTNITIGGSVPENLQFSNLKELRCLRVGGDTSTFERVALSDCPQFTQFAFARTNSLRKVDLSKVSARLVLVDQREYWDSSDTKQTSGIKNLEEMIIGRAPQLRKIRMQGVSVKKWDIKYSSLKKLNTFRVNILNSKESIDLSSCKKLNDVIIRGRYRKVVLPNRELQTVNYDESYVQDYIVPFGAKEGAQILDLSKAGSKNKYVKFLLKKMIERLKEGKTYTKTVVVNRNVYNGNRSILKKIQKKGIKVQVK